MSLTDVRERLVEEMRSQCGTEAALRLEAALVVATREKIYQSYWDRDPWRVRVGRDVLARRLARRPIRVRLDAVTLPSVLDHGLLNAHEMCDRDVAYLDARRAVELAAFGIPLDAEPTQRPRFGFIGGWGDHYGDTELVLRDEVKADATFCVGDIMVVWVTTEVTSFDAPSGRGVVREDHPWRPQVDMPTDDMETLWSQRVVEVQMHRPVTRDDIVLVRGGEDTAAIAAQYGIRHELMDGSLPDWWCEPHSRVTREGRRIQALARAGTPVCVCGPSERCDMCTVCDCTGDDLCGWCADPATGGATRKRYR